VIAVTVWRAESRGVLLHSLFQLGQFGDLLVYLGAVVVVVRQGIVDFCRAKLRKLTQDLLDR
jgi:hypothetical protein